MRSKITVLALSSVLVMCAMPFIVQAAIWLNLVASTLTGLGQ